MGKLVWSLAEIDPKLVKKFEKALIDDETTYRKWLFQQIENYLKKKKMLKPWDRLRFVKPPGKNE